MDQVQPPRSAESHHAESIATCRSSVPAGYDSNASRNPCAQHGERIHLRRTTLKTIKTLLFTMAALALSAVPSFAQTQVDIGASTNAITFTGLGSGNTSQIGMTLGSCSKGVCTLSGKTAVLDGVPSVKGAYSFSTAATNQIRLNKTATAGYYTISQTSGINFLWGASKSPLLTGTVQLHDFQQTGSSPTGDFNGDLHVNLTITGGSEASLFTGNEGILSFTVKVNGSATNRNLSSLLGTTNTRTASITTGNITP